MPTEPVETEAARLRREKFERNEKYPHRLANTLASAERTRARLAALADARAERAAKREAAAEQADAERPKPPRPRKRKQTK